jgi:uncharacterized membrane protein YdbT with pleckstrin-like domain
MLHMNPNEQQDIKVRNPLTSMQPGERNLFEVKRHPIGILGIYVGAAVLLAVLAVLIYGVVPSLLTSVDHSRIYGYGTIVLLVTAVFTLIFLLVSHAVYWGNRWILTTDSLTQVVQNSLFSKQSSQLSLGNLEDVTAVQNGVLAHMFNYGVLRVETAGERSKFVFPFCPKPNQYAQAILQAREQFEQGRRGDSEQRPYREQDAYVQPGAPSGTASYEVPTDEDVRQ